VAVLGNRGTGLLDMMIEGFRNQGQEVITPFNMSPVDRQRTPLQQAMNRPEVMLSQPGGQNMVTFDRGRTFDASPIPQVQAAAQSAAQPMSAQQLRAAMPRITPMQVATAQPESNIPVNRLIGGQQTEMGQGVMQPGMDREKMMRDAKVAKDVLETGDESLIERAKSYFGSRENMLRLAMAFNTMRLEPDQGLARALGTELGEIRKTKTSQMSQGQIVSYLQQNGYPQLAQVAAQNPNMAKTIMEQVLQKELKPAASPKSFEPIKDPTTGQFSIPVYNPETNTTDFIPIEGAVGETPAQKGERETAERDRDRDLAEGRKKGQEAFKRANLYRNDINYLYQALEAAQDPNTQVGFLNQYLPAFTSSTEALREAGNRLGLGVVSSVTFGALSASELSLALKTGLDLTLPRAELIKAIERRIAAQEKLYEELMNDAELLAGGIGENEYTRIVAERRRRNKAIQDKLPDLQQKIPSFTKNAWRQLNANQQKKLLENNGIVVEFVQ